MHWNSISLIFFPPFCLKAFRIIYFSFISEICHWNWSNHIWLNIGDIRAVIFEYFNLFISHFGCSKILQTNLKVIIQIVAFVWFNILQLWFKWSHFNTIVTILSCIWHEIICIIHFSSNAICHSGKCFNDSGATKKTVAIFFNIFDCT